MSDQNKPATAQMRQLLNRALSTIRHLKRQINIGSNVNNEPIAVIGMGCRLPGGADTPDRLWRLLIQGRDAISAMPRDRLYQTDFFNADPDIPGKAYVMSGGFIDKVDEFDAELFGITPQEAIGMDPQQRIALETVWQALENASIAPDSLTGRKVGIYFGASTNDYVRLRQQYLDPATIDAYQFYGETSFIAGRIAYTLGTNGPAEMIDTSCSSSLVAVHHACRSLRCGESDIAIAGGVNLILSPYGFVLVSKLRAVSADGRCKTFDAAADGYARGEGCVAMTLKRLGDAIHDGDPIIGLISGTMVNHDGRSSGITVPSMTAQQEVIRGALIDANLQPKDINYVEAHGTGTPLGDPIELRALDHALGKAAGRSAPLNVGSIKTNIGHLEPVAGIAGLMKLLLSLQHGAIPPHLHLHRPNPNINWTALNLKITTETEPWPRSTEPRHGGVSSFGVTGTNAHIVASEAPALSRTQKTTDRNWRVITISGKSENPRRQNAGRLERFISQNPDIPLTDICLTANTGRALFDYRFTAVYDNKDTLSHQLAAYAARKLLPGTCEGNCYSGRKPLLAFLFPGQGSQFASMGRELYLTEPVFSKTVNDCDEILRPMLGFSLVEMLYHRPNNVQETLLNETHITQPAVFTIEYALAQLWHSWGIKPHIISGHSFGEIVATCVAGSLSLPDALTMVEARGRLSADLPPNGVMFAINTSEAEVRAEIEKQNIGLIEIAGINSPEDCIIAGNVDASLALAQHFRAKNIRVKKLKVSHPFHSSAMSPMLNAFRNVVAGLKFSTPEIPIVSNLTGNIHTQQTLSDPDYWCRHTVEPVNFSAGLEQLAIFGIEIYLEVGAQPVLLPYVARHPASQNAIRIASIRKDSPADYEMQNALGALFVNGIEADFKAVHAGDGAKRIAMPGYAFQHKRYWFNKADIMSDAKPNTIKQQNNGFGAIAACLLASKLDQPHLAFHTTLTYDDFLAFGALKEEDFIILANPVIALLPFAIGNMLCPQAVFSVTTHKIAPQIVIRLGEILELHTVCRKISENSWNIDIHMRTSTEAAFHYQWRQLAFSTLTVLNNVELPTEKLIFEDAELLPSENLLCQRLPGIAVKKQNSQTDIRFAQKCPVLQRAGDLGLALALKTQQREETLEYRPVCLHAPFSAIGQISDVSVIDAIGFADQYITLYNESGVACAKIETPELFLIDTVEDIACHMSLPDVLYTMDWEERENIADPKNEPGNALILNDQSGVGDAFAKILQQKGWNCNIVEYQISEISPQEQAEIAIQSALENKSTIPSHIFSFWCLDLPGSDMTDVSNLKKINILGINPLLQIIKILAKTAGPLPRLWIATSNAQPVGSIAQPLCVAAAPIWGLAKTIALEHPELWGGIVDLESNPFQSLEKFAKIILHPDQEDNIVIRSDKRFVARLNPKQADSLPHDIYHPPAQGWHLITGGLGGIGLEIGHWLAKQGARQIAITGRKPICESELPTEIKIIKALGCDIKYFPVDVTDQKGMAELITLLSSSPSGLRGIIHAAGVSIPQDIIEAQPEIFAKVMKPKVEGSWILHELTLHLDLDYFVMFSTIACVWGSQHVGNYAAANQFLDMLAFHRRALGLPALCIDWGLWSTGSHLFNAEVENFLKSVGLKKMPSQQNLTILGRLLRTKQNHLVAAGVDWARFKPLLTSRGPRPLLDNIIVSEHATIEPFRPTDIRERLITASQEQKKQIMDDYVWRQYSYLLGIEVEHILTKLEDGGSLTDFGLDSLLVMEMISRLRKDIGLKINANDFFNCPGLQWPVFLLEAFNNQMVRH